MPLYDDGFAYAETAEERNARVQKELRADDVARWINSHTRHIAVTHKTENHVWAIEKVIFEVRDENLLIVVEDLED